MPGPLSTPAGWTPAEHFNHASGHGTATGNVRHSGKTAWDHQSGKWAAHMKNQDARREAG